VTVICACAVLKIYAYNSILFADIKKYPYNGTVWYSFCVNFFLLESDSEEEDPYADPPYQEEGNRARFRAARLKNRKVHDIDSSLDPSNYNPMT
jgi:hypothetical protein